MAAKFIRLHEGGKVITEAMDVFAKANGTNAAGARKLIQSWVDAGDLVPRKDGGYDVIRWRPRVKVNA